MSFCPDGKTGRLAAAVATAGLLLVACTATAGNTGHSSAACVASLTFRGQTYTGTSLRTHPPYDEIGLVPLPHLHKIGTATLPACHDTNSTSTVDRPWQIEIARIDTIDPGIAIAEFPRGGVYVRHGATLPVTLTTAPWIRWYKSG